MEIRLKTASEFRDAHMTIEIRATSEEAVQVSERLTGELGGQLGDRLYTAAEVGDLQASENERAERLTIELRTARDRDDRMTAKVAEQAAELSRRASAIKTLESRYETLLATLDKAEDDQADATAEHRQSIAARDRMLAAATARVRTAREILSAPKVAGAQGEIVTTKGAILADAITAALAALDA